MKNVPRRMYVWDLHGHDKGSETTFDYVAIFERLSTLVNSNAGLVFENESKGTTTVVSSIKRSDYMFLIEMFEIDGTDYVPVFDRETGQLNTRHKLTGEIATLDWAIIDAEDRRIYYQRKQSAIGINKILAVLSYFAKNSEKRQISLKAARAVDSSFFERIDELDIIKEVSIQLTEPNLDWKDANELAAQAGSSNAAEVSLNYTAAPRESLNKDKGVIEELRKETTGEHSSVVEAKIKGRKQGETNNRTISMEDNQKSIMFFSSKTASMAEFAQSALKMLKDVIRPADSSS